MKARMLAVLTSLLLGFLLTYQPNLFDLKHDRLDTRRATFGCPERGFKQDVYMHACLGYGNAFAILRIAPTPYGDWMVLLHPNYDWFEQETLPEEGRTVKSGTPVVLEEFSDAQGYPTDTIKVLVLPEDTMPTASVHITEFDTLATAQEAVCWVAKDRMNKGFWIVGQPGCFTTIRNVSFEPRLPQRSRAFL
jgi:hypothetical protein